MTEKKNLFDADSWSSTKEELLRGLESQKDGIFKSVFQSTEIIRKQIEEREAEKARREALTPEERDAEDIIKKLKGEVEYNPLFPMIRRIIPNTIANEITGVQPMQGPSGDIFTLKFRYKDAE